LGEKPSNSSSKSGFKNRLRLFLIGGAMGIANIIPGVSGGTIAVVFNIYGDLMEALGNFLTDKEYRWNHVTFLAILFGGAVISIVAFARLLSWAFDNYELMTVYFFMGLILGSIPVVIRSHSDMKINIRRSAGFLLGAALVVILALLQTDAGTQSRDFDPNSYGVLHYLYFLICGAVAASAMIVPGLSGSFVMILLGAYRTALDSISAITSFSLSDGISHEIKVRFMIVISILVGVIFGILGFAKLMSLALKHHHAFTMYIILGLIIGSFYQLFPGFSFDLNGAGAIVTFIIGLIISLKFGASDSTI